MNIIEVNGLTKRYGKTLAVDHLSFQIEEQTIVGFCRQERGRKDNNDPLYAGFS